MRSRILFALGLLILSGCASVRIPDTEWCGDMGSEGAACFHTLSDESRDIPKAEWDEYRFGQVCTTANDFASIKTALEKLCSMAGKRCKYYVKQAIAGLEAKMLVFESRVYQLQLQKTRDAETK